MRRMIVLLVALLVLGGCDGVPPIPSSNATSASSDGSGAFPDFPPEKREPQLKGTVGVSLGILFVSMDTNGELEIGVGGELPILPTPLGMLRVFAEGSVEFPRQQTLTISTGEQTWFYDIQDETFTVELRDVDATVKGDGKGNILVLVTDNRVRKDADPRFYNADVNSRITMNEGASLPVEQITIGYSANGTPMTFTRLGSGPKVVALVGGFHAGFAPGTVSVAEKMIDYFSEHGEQIPVNVSLYVLPLASPDSLNGAVETKAGRVNGNGVDLNRNWDCNWSNTAQWRSVPVNPGSYAFSEPETVALRDFFLTQRPAAVVFYEARGELVIPGDRTCGQRNSQSGSQNLASVYGARSGYEYGFINYYPISGDVTDWLDRQGIPAISILLSDYTAVDWNRNLQGVQDVLAQVAR